MTNAASSLRDTPLGEEKFMHLQRHKRDLDDAGTPSATKYEEALFLRESIESSALYVEKKRDSNRASIFIYYKFLITRL